MFRYLVLMGSLKKSPSVRSVRSIVYIEYVRYINNNFFNKSRKARYGNVYVILGVLFSRLKKVGGRICGTIRLNSELNIIIILFDPIAMANYLSKSPSGNDDLSSSETLTQKNTPVGKTV